ncbi:hypothetical protein GCM10010208_74820 [Actinomadura livida]|nr:hypothetical protein GCM10010208_74820 [Actinomadura livida]
MGTRGHPPQPPRPLAEPVQLTTTLGDLAAYSMITLDASAVTVHRLVQAVARTPDSRTVAEDGDPHRQPADVHAARDEATDLLNEARPATTDDPAEWAHMAPPAATHRRPRRTH